MWTKNVYRGERNVYKGSLLAYFRVLAAGLGGCAGSAVEMVGKGAILSMLAALLCLAVRRLC